MRLNGWQRLWVVLSALWLIPFAIALFAIGLTPIYMPPELTEWTLLCNAIELQRRLPADATPLIEQSVGALPEEKRLELDEVVQRMLKAGEPDSNIQLVVDTFKAKHGVAKGVHIRFWRPSEDKTDATNPDCADIEIVYNPKTKQKQLSVHAKLIPYGNSYASGYDLDSALDETLQREVVNSENARRDELLWGSTFAFGVPAFLYAFGAAIAWIRRGFRQPKV